MEEIAKKKGGRGGARKGAGRKFLDKKSITLSLDRVLVEILKKFPNSSTPANEAVREYFEKKGYI